MIGPWSLPWWLAASSSSSPAPRRQPAKRPRPITPDVVAPPEPAPAGRRRRQITRDTVLFAAGLGLTIYEAVIRHGEPRPSLLVVYVGMMGLPAVFQADGVLAQLLQRKDPPK